MSVFNCNYSQTRNRHDPSPPSVVLPVVTSVQRSDDDHPLCVTHPGSLASSVWWRRCTGHLTSTARLDDQQPIAAVCRSHLLLLYQHRVLLSHYLSIPNLARCPSICLPFYISLSLYIYRYILRSIYMCVYIYIYRYSYLQININPYKNLSQPITKTNKTIRIRENL